MIKPSDEDSVLPFLPFSRPSVTQADIDAVSEVLASGWLTTGKRCEELENRFAEYVGSPHAVAVTSATAAMHLLLHALDIGPGDEVVTPSMTWVSAVNLVVLRGATPVFVDVERDTLMTTAAHVEQALTPRTKLILPVHFAGASLDLDALNSLAERRGIPLAEDAAHAAGTSYKGRRIGNRGTAIFSFHPIKNMTTGEGGLVCTDDAALAAHIRRLRFHGLGADTFQRESQGRSPQAEVVEPGYKYNLPDMNAALGVSQLERLEAMNARRAALARRYGELFARIDGIEPLGIPSYPMGHSWHLYVVRVDEKRCGIRREAFMAGLKQRKIGTGIHFRAAHTQAYYRNSSLEIPPLPNTDWNSERVCSLPLFPDMEISDVERVVAEIESVLRGARR
jgi:UDP-4-amino-4-deoxy-L-arabinose-oxoglutarate aminotransferase